MDWQTNLITGGAELAALLRDLRRVAVLGIRSEHYADRPAHYVPATLASAGLEIVPARLEELLDAGDELGGRAAIDGYAVHFAAKALGAEVVRPEFDPGDALFFDERMAHRTYLAEHMTQERLAVECWFFSPAHPNSEYLSLLV